LRRQNSAALASIESALANSHAVKIRFLSARALVEMGDIARARTLATGLASELQNESQAYSRILEGEVALKMGEPREAIKVFLEANTSWTPGWATSTLEEPISRPAPSSRRIQSSTAASSVAAKPCNCFWASRRRMAPCLPFTTTRVSTAKDSRQRALQSRIGSGFAASPKKMLWWPRSRSAFASKSGSV
jgi:hypothetical protein